MGLLRLVVRPSMIERICLGFVRLSAAICWIVFQGDWVVRLGVVLLVAGVLRVMQVVVVVVTHARLVIEDVTLLVRKVHHV